MLADPPASRPETGPAGAPVPVVVVEDWADTFRLPPHLVRAWDPGPGWVVPAGVVVGLGLVVATWAAGSTLAWQLVVAVAVTAFVAAWVVLALGGTRMEGPASAVATAAWIWAAWGLATGIGVAGPLAAAFVAVGAVGQVIAGARRRRLALRRRDALREIVDGGARRDGWVVAVVGPPWQRDPTLQAADGSGRTWAAEHPAWRGLRAEVGHPVGIWGTAAGDAVVVLAPRRRPT